MKSVSMSTVVPSFYAGSPRIQNSPNSGFRSPQSVSVAGQPHAVRFGFTELFNVLDGIANAFGNIFVLGAAGCALIAGTEIVINMMQIKENKKNRPADTIFAVTALMTGAEADLTPDNKVYIKGKCVGRITESGEAFNENDQKLGHANADGQLFSLFSSEPIGRLTEGRSVVLKRDPEGKAVFANHQVFKDNAIPLETVGATALVLLKNLYP